MYTSSLVDQTTKCSTATDSLSLPEARSQVARLTKSLVTSQLELAAERTMVTTLKTSVRDLQQKLRSATEKNLHDTEQSRLEVMRLQQTLDHERSLSHTLLQQQQQQQQKHQEELQARDQHEEQRLSEQEHQRNRERRLQQEEQLQRQRSLRDVPLYRPPHSSQHPISVVLRSGVIVSSHQEEHQRRRVDVENVHHMQPSRDRSRSRDRDDRAV